MPPLEMSLKACSIPFPMDPMVNVRFPSKYNVERNNESKLKLDEPPIFRPPWTKNKYFPFTHPKSQDVSVPTTTRGRRGVRFVSVVTIHSVLHVKDFTPDELNDTWYSRREIRAMKQQCKQEAIQGNTSSNAHETEQGTTTAATSHLLPLSDSTNNVNVVNNNNNDSNYNNGGELTSTMRGLESKTSMGSLRKKRHRLQAWKAVFLEQRRQHLEGYYDPDTLADVYFEVSEPCHVAANMVAMRDARDVQFQYNTEEEEDCHDPVTWEKENQPNIPRPWADDDIPPPPPPLIGGRYRSLIAMHSNRIRHEQRSLTVEVA